MLYPYIYFVMTDLSGLSDEKPVEVFLFSEFFFLILQVF